MLLAHHRVCLTWTWNGWISHLIDKMSACSHDAGDQAIFIMARVLPGLLKCGVAVSQAFVTDVSAPSERAQNLGRRNLSQGSPVCSPALLNVDVAWWGPLQACWEPALAWRSWWGLLSVACSWAGTCGCRSR